MKKLLFFIAAVLLGLFPSLAQKEFSYEDLIYRVIEGNQVEVCGYQNPNVNILNIPSIVNPEGSINYVVIRIGEFSLQDNNQLVSVTIPSTVETIAWGAFEGCSSLQVVNLTNGLQRIENNAFGSCSSLKTIDIPESVNFIQEGEDQPSIIYGSFNNCTALEAINVSPQNEYYASIDGVLYDKSFQNLFKVPAAIKELNMPEMLFYIHAHAAQECFNITTIEIPSHVKIIGCEAFVACENVTDIIIGGEVEEIGYGAFGSFGNGKLKNVDLGGALKKIGPFAFYQTFSLENLTFPDQLEEIGDNAFGRSGLKNIKLPQNISNIGANAFSGCENLESADLSSSSIVLLSADCFSSCYNLKSIYLPETLKFIGGNTFGDCEKLNYLKCLAIDPPSCSSNTFETYHYDNVGLQVPDASINSYENTIPWSYFKNIVDLNYKAVSSVSINVPQEIIQEGSTLQLSVDITPADASFPNISWDVIEGECLSIDDTGLITAHYVGKAVIQVTVQNAISSVQSEINIFVVNLSVNGPQGELSVGSTEQLSADFIIPDQTVEDLTISWSSSDEKVATVDNNGIVTAIGEGTATITVSLEEYPDIKSSYVVTVVEDAGVESLLAYPNSKISIYSTDGTLIRRDCMAEELKSLAKGIYIIVSGKARYKISI